MMPTMDALHFGPPPARFVLWGGPADGQPVNVETCTHGDWPDVVIPLKSQTLPGVVPDESWEPTRDEARYRYNHETDRYEYVRP